MQYKGFIANYQYVGDIGLFVGEISHSHDTISFSAPTFKQLEESMMIAVDNYLGNPQSSILKQKIDLIS